MKTRSITKTVVRPTTLLKFLLFSWQLTFFAMAITSIYSCSELASQSRTPVTSQQPVVAHKIAIVNASNNVVDTVEYKPCGSAHQHYQTLTNMLRPSETLSITIYSQCVDLMATNAFKKTLVDSRNVDLRKTQTWTIK